MFLNLVEIGLNTEICYLAEVYLKTTVFCLNYLSFLKENYITCKLVYFNKI